MQGVLSRASFRRPRVSGQETFAVLSLHISNIYAKKKRIAKKLILTIRAIMISQKVDLVAGDFNGTAWRCRSRNNISTIDEAFTDCALPSPPGPPPLWGLGSIFNCGRRLWISQTTGFRSILEGAHAQPRRTLGLRPTGRSCHHETWLHLVFVDWSNTLSKQGEHDRRISLTERPVACSYGHQK